MFSLLLPLSAGHRVCQEEHCPVQRVCGWIPPGLSLLRASGPIHDWGSRYIGRRKLSLLWTESPHGMLSLTVNRCLSPSTELVMKRVWEEAEHVKLPLYALLGALFRYCPTDLSLACPPSFYSIYLVVSDPASVVWAGCIWNFYTSYS